MVDRPYLVTVIGDRIQIDTKTLKNPLKQKRKYARFSYASAARASSSKLRHNPLGILEKDVQLPAIPEASKVLDIGAGTGFISKKIKDTFGCDVYALEPSFERSSDFSSCVERLGNDHVEQLTLQDALTQFPEKYFQAFDVVCVFKYNVPCDQKEDFVRALSQVVKPNGLVYVTSVEPERFTFDSYTGNAPYLTDIFRKHFGNVSFTTRSSVVGADELMTLTEPKLALNNELSSVSNSFNQ